MIIFKGLCIPQSGSIKTKDTAEECGPPAKCLKCDNDGSKFVTQNVASATWIKIDRIALTFVNKQIIIDCQKLHDEHIHCGQCLMHPQFPGIGGLCSTFSYYNTGTMNSLELIHS